MRPERAVVDVLVKVALALVVLYLCYRVVIATRMPSPPQPVGRQGAVMRVLDVLRRGFHIKSPYLSDEELREKARRYLQ